MGSNSSSHQAPPMQMPPPMPAGGSDDPYDMAKLAEYKQVFDRLDVNNSGNITAPELQMAFAGMGVHHTPGQVSEMVNQFDQNNNNALDFPEFLMLMNHETNSSEAQQPQAVQQQPQIYGQPPQFSQLGGAQYVQAAPAPMMVQSQGMSMYQQPGLTVSQPITMAQPQVQMPAVQMGGQQMFMGGGQQVYSGGQVVGGALPGYGMAQW